MWLCVSAYFCALTKNRSQWRNVQAMCYVVMAHWRWWCMIPCYLARYLWYAFQSIDSHRVHIIMILEWCGGKTTRSIFEPDFAEKWNFFQIHSKIGFDIARMPPIPSSFRKYLNLLGFFVAVDYFFSRQFFFKWVEKIGFFSWTPQNFSPEPLFDFRNFPQKIWYGKYAPMMHFPKI